MGDSKNNYSICMLFYINDLHSIRQKSENEDSVSDIKSEDLTLLTFTNV